MAKNFKTQLTGQIGESLVVAELGRKGIVATSFAGNVPDIDILAFANSRTLHLQVKAMRTDGTQFNASNFINIKFEGEVQRVCGIKEELEPELVFVFVQIGDVGRNDRFFILTQKDLQDIICSNHTEWLAKHNGVRPRNPMSTHVALKVTSIEVFENNWTLIKQRLTMG